MAKYGWHMLKIRNKFWLLWFYEINLSEVQASFDLDHSFSF